MAYRRLTCLRHSVSLLIREIFLDGSEWFRRKVEEEVMLHFKSLLVNEFLIQKDKGLGVSHRPTPLVWLRTPTGTILLKLFTVLSPVKMLHQNLVNASTYRLLSQWGRSRAC